MDLPGILLDFERLHSAADTTLTVLVGVLLVLSLAMFAAATWRDLQDKRRRTGACPCGCGVPVTEACRPLLETPPPPIPPLYNGKHRREADDRAGDTASVRGGTEGVPAHADAGDSAWAPIGPLVTISDPRLLNVWGFPPDHSRGVSRTGGGGAVPLPDRASGAVAAASSEHTIAADSPATTATDLPVSA